MRPILRALAFAAVLLLLPGLAVAQQPQFPQNVPANSVIGRTGIGPGPSEAIPFNRLLPLVGGTVGPGSSTDGDFACFSGVTGKILKDCGGTQRVITAAGPVAVGATDSQILINKTTPATTTVNLPAAATRGQLVLTVTDFAGNAAAFNITIVPNGSETINGKATVSIKFNRHSLDLEPVAGVGWGLK